MGKATQSREGERATAPRETTLPETGEYSRTLDADEYREWVRQTVSGQIWGRMTAIFSAVGFAAILAIFTVVANVSNTIIEGKIATEIKSVQKELPTVVAGELDKQVRTHELTQKITSSAVQQIQAERTFETEIGKLVVSQSLKILRDPASTASLRELALQQVILFGTKDEKARTIEAVILDEKPEKLKSREFDLALQHYQANDKLDQYPHLRNILNRATLSDSSFSDEGWKNVLKMLEVAEYATEASRWIKSALFHPGDRYSTESLEEITERIAKANTLLIAEQFVGWIESGDSKLVNLARKGLGAIPRRTMTLDENGRRHQLVARTVQVLARLEKDRDNLLERVNAARQHIRQRDLGSLQKLVDAERNLARSIGADVAGIGTDPNDRSLWVAVDRKLSQIIRDESRHSSRSSSEILAQLLNLDPRAGDWPNLVELKLAEAGGNWTKPGEAQLLVSAWIRALQASTAPDQTSVDAAAKLYLNAHLQSDLAVLTNDIAEYRFLIGKAGDGLIRTFVESVPGMIGGAERPAGSKEKVDANEAEILAEVLMRAVRSPLSLESLARLRTALQDRSNRVQRDHALWLSAIGIVVGSKSATGRQPDYHELLSALIGKAQRGERPRENEIGSVGALALIYLVANANYLNIPSIQGAAERVNLHRLADTLSSQSGDPVSRELASTISTEAKGAFGWVDSLKTRSVALGAEPLPLPSGEGKWVSVAMKPNQTAQIVIQPASETSYLLVGPNGRVIHAQTIPDPRTGNAPLLINLFTNETGDHHVRIRVRSDKPNPTAELRYGRVYRAGDLRSAKKGAINTINDGEAVTIESEGNDDAWFRFAARAKHTYVLRTHNLRARRPGEDLDTNIEIFDQSEDHKLGEDDDSGRDAGGGKWSSLVTMAPEQDMVYHVRIQNIEATAGSMMFEINEKPEGISAR